MHLCTCYGDRPVNLFICIFLDMWYVCNECQVCLCMDVYFHVHACLQVGCCFYIHVFLLVYMCVSALQVVCTRLSVYVYAEKDTF